MIQIYPKIDFSEKSPYGEDALIPLNILWQGIHVCVEALCAESKQTVIADLAVGHAVTFPCMINLLTHDLFCSSDIKKWLGIPFLHSLQKPDYTVVPFTVEKLKKYSDIIILNCIDNYYGHSLLKLFNAEKHLDNDKKYGLVVIVQKNLRWLVPDGAAEIWTVDLPMSKSQNYFTSLNDQIHNECQRFTNIFVSKAYSHPTIMDIRRYTRVQSHDYQIKRYRITFIWRSDRPWIENVYFIEALKYIGLSRFMLQLQNMKIKKVFKKVRKKIADAHFTVVGLGTETSFPSWIEDKRVKNITVEMENQMCKIYAESRVIIGVHGSNMLLPSAQAGMTVDLMPEDRWSNFSQDIVFQEQNARLSSFRYRFLPISTRIKIIAQIIISQAIEFDFFKQQMQH